MFEKSRVRKGRGSRGQIKCECEAVVSCGKRGASSHHGVSLTRKKKRGRKSGRRQQCVASLVLVEVVELDSWVVELEED